MSHFIDIGVNLTNKSLARNLDAVIERAKAVGVMQMVVTGTNIEESQKAIELCEQYPEQLICTAGIHPHHASDWKPDTETILRQLAENDCVRAVGETGLDFNRNYSPREAQIEAFRQQLELAISIDKPILRTNAMHMMNSSKSYVNIETS